MKNEKRTIMVVEDEEAIMLGLEENLRSAGYDVITAAEGKTAVKLATEKRPDLVLLDIMLPGISGFEVCRQLREAKMQMPIIMLTARADEFDKIHGFETGADDYVTKPFSINELLARIKAVLARGVRRNLAPARYECGDFVLDMEARLLLKKGKAVELTRTEFDLLAYFCANDGKALSREQVMNDVWGLEYYGTQRSLDSFVASLRAIIEKKPSKPEHILTVHGVGYKFVK
jgi:two-component system alkaline phosphatase synthesis response regulator PhoP